MLISISAILLSGLLFGWICNKIRFPALFGMIIAGILIGPHMLGLLDSSILDISTQLRRIALIIILIRAGLKLDAADLKKVGRPAILMCFVPACFEIIGMVLLAPKLLGLSVLDSAILGAVVAAVSPAVVVPRMIRLKYSYLFWSARLWQLTVSDMPAFQQLYLFLVSWYFVWWACLSVSWEQGSLRRKRYSA